MNTRLRFFKHTFIVLSIMCCILLGCTTLIYALGGMDNLGISLGRIPSETSVATADKAPAPTTAQASKTAEDVSPDSSTTTADIVLTNATDTGAKASSTGTAAKATVDPTVQTPVQSSVVSAEGQQNTSEAGEEKNSSIPGKQGKETLPDKLEHSSPTPSLTISAVGDIMAHQGNLNNAYSPKTGVYDFSGFLEYVNPYLSDTDLTIGNFETVTAGPKSGYTSYPNFNTPDAILTALSQAGFDILSTANNHSLDRGINGLTRTIQMINKNKMINIGSSADGRNKYSIRDINGIKVAVLAYSGLYNGIDRKLSMVQKNTHLCPLEEQQIQKDIKAAKAARADAVIVVVHWGSEYQRTPDSSQTSLAKKMLSWGADIILGSHPHVIQKSEIVKVNGKDKFIIYSMGNFISGYRRIDKMDRPNKIYTEDGVIVKLRLEKDGKSGIVIKSVNYVPTWVDKYYVSGRPVFKIIPISNANISGNYVTAYNKPFIIQSYKNTMGIMAKMK